MSGPANAGVNRRGQGSMSLVFLGWDLRSGEKVAVKLLAPQLVNRPHFIARFEREARIVSALRHPNVISLFAVVIARGMGRTPGERYPTVAAFVEALRMALSAAAEQVQIAPPPSAVDTLAQEDDSTQRMAEPATS